MAVYILSSLLMPPVDSIGREIFEGNVISTLDERHGHSRLLLFDLLALVAFAQSIDVDQILCSARRKLCNQ